MDILFLSRRIFLGDGSDNEELFDGGIIVTNDGKVRTILRSSAEVNTFMYNNSAESVIDFENKVLMPGLIDPNVHVNDPGRKDWETFATATKAAAAGGYTFIADMPVYSIPPTINGENLQLKAMAARGKIYIDVGLWGGIVPQNTSVSFINPLLRNGAIGLYSTLCPSQVPEFPACEKEDIEYILNNPEAANSTISLHAEILPSTQILPDESQSKKYETFLKTRPSNMELNAVEMIANLSMNSAEAIPVIENCNKNGGNLTVETCPHYLAFSSENIDDTRTELKCNPPIRDQFNQEQLWKAIINKTIYSISSNHSPTTPGKKSLTYGRNRGDFIKAWSGIASLQFGLSIFWTKCRKYGLSFEDVHRLFCKNPAELLGISQVKGCLKEGYDADFCIWDPEEEFTVTSDMIHFLNKSNPYMNMKLTGVIYGTVVRGLHVFEKDQEFGQPLGRIILRRSEKQVVKFK